MNIQRFILPATIAAALHAVMLLPGKVPVIICPAEDKPGSESPILPKEEDLIEVPLVNNEQIDEPEPQVKELIKGEALPTIPDSLAENPYAEFQVPTEKTPPTKVQMDTKIIGQFGDPNGRPDGSPVNTGFYLPKQLDKTPRTTVQMPPEYPVTLRHDGVEGTVMVEFDVDVRGRVLHARVRESTHRGFEETTLRAVSKWRFEPGLSNGRPVPFRMVIPVNFSIGAG